MPCTGTEPHGILSRCHQCRWECQSRQTSQLADFRACQSFVLDLKPKLFPEGSVVRVDVPQFRGHGIVHRLTGENEIQVLLENGNVWAYPSLCCFPEPDASNWPAWIKRKKEVPDEQPQS